jgi:hypothetical protein
MELSRSALYSPRDARNIRVFNTWLLAGMLCFVAVTILLGGKILQPGPLAWALAIVTIVLIAMAVRSYVLFLRDADELLRKIQLEALSLSFGAAALFMLGWRLLERLGAPKLDVDDPFLVMAVVWAAGQWYGFRRYGMTAEEGR